PIHHRCRRRETSPPLRWGPHDAGEQGGILNFRSSSGARARTGGTALATLDRKARIRAVKLGMVTALLVGGLGVTTQIGSAQSIGALCDGRPASHPWLDASGQAGPTFIEGTRGDDVIIGSDGDDNIFGNGGNDIICGGPGTDNLNAGPGGDSVEEGGPGDDSLGTVGGVH